MGELHLQTTHVVLRTIRRCKFAESLQLSLDFHFIMTNLEGILIIHVLGLFLVKKIRFQQKFCSPSALFTSDWRQTVKGRDSIRSMEDSFQSTAEEEIESQMKSQGLEIINIGLINLHISSISCQSLQPQCYHFIL